MRRLSDESGASLPIIAVAIVVLLGVVGLSVDFGFLYWERRQLQNGADAAVIAIAHDCARGVIPCDLANATATADFYADENSEDGTSAVESVTLDVPGRTVTVVTSTLEISGSDKLAPTFGKLVGYDGATVGAEASAMWGFAGGGLAIPLIFSDCEWEKLVGPVGPPWDYDFPTANTNIFFHGDSEACHESPSGQDLPGGFGWLENAGNCSAYINEDNWVYIDPGASATSGCTPEFMREEVLGHTVPLPFFDDLVGTGENAQYHVVAFGGFHTLGYNFGGQYKEEVIDAEDPLYGQLPCTGSDRCIYGYFDSVSLTGGVIGGQDRGVYVVALTN